MFRMTTNIKLTEYERYILDCVADCGNTGLVPPTGERRKSWRKLHRFGLLKNISTQYEVYVITTKGEEYRNEQDS